MASSRAVESESANKRLRAGTRFAKASGMRNQSAIRIVLNGKAAADDAIRQAVCDLRSSGHAIEVRVTWEAGDAERFAREAVEQKCQAVVAAGGDGTLNEVVNGLFAASSRRAPRASRTASAVPPTVKSRRSSPSEKAKCALGIIPFGTANDFALGCGIPVDPAAALELATTAEPAWIDVGKVNGRYFLNCATGGYGAQVTADTPPEMKRILGGFAYLVTGVASMTSLAPRAIRLKAPRLTWEGNVLGLVVANGRQSGGGLQIAPNGLLDDGLLDLLIIPESPLSELLGLLGELSRLGGENDFVQIVHRQIPWVEVEAPDGLHVNVDGEPIQGEYFRFETAPRALPCFLSPTAPLVSSTLRDPANSDAQPVS